MKVDAKAEREEEEGSIEHKMNEDTDTLRSAVAETALVLVVCYVSFVAFITIFNARLPPTEFLVSATGFVLVVILPVEIAINREWPKTGIVLAVALGVLAGSVYRWHMIPGGSRELGFGIFVFVTAIVFTPPAFAALAVYRYRLTQTRRRNSWWSV